MFNSCPGGDRPLVRLPKRGLPPGEFTISVDITAVEGRVLGKAAGVIGHGSKYGGVRHTSLTEPGLPGSRGASLECAKILSGTE